MNVLLAGELTPMIWGMVPRLERDNHRVTLMGRLTGPQPAAKAAVFHDLGGGTQDMGKIMLAGNFQVVVFFFGYQCEDTDGKDATQGAAIDLLLEFYHTSAEHQVERFVLVTDQRVFGTHQKAKDGEEPLPDTREGILMKAAEDCLEQSDPFGMSSLLVRVTHLYSPAHGDAFFSRAVFHAKNNKPMSVDGTEDTPCDFLHVDDFALFLCLALEDHTQGVVHLANGDLSTYETAQKAIAQLYPGFAFRYRGRQGREMSMKTTLAIKKLSWLPRHRVWEELSDILAGNLGRHLKARKWALPLWLRRGLIGRVLPWVELFALAGAAYGLTALSQVYATFRFVDFWLFYTILMGTLHGGILGGAAALIACVFYGVAWVGQGSELYLLLYNLDNWLPMMMYTLAGGLFGYMHDKISDELRSTRQEKERREKQATFLDEMYTQVSLDRSRLQKQVMHYRDSYGKILNITRDLDSMQPEQVFLATLKVLEDTMENSSVAIYSRVGMTTYARLLVHSRAYAGKLATSLDVSKLALLKERLDKGEVYTNTALEAGHPAYAAPVMREGLPIAMIALWEVPYDRQTLYHQNLLSVVVAFVQSALVRSLDYVDLSQDMYLEGTQILTDRAFSQALDTYRRMSRQSLSDYLLLRVWPTGGTLAPAQMDNSIAKAVWATDYRGRTAQGDYVLLLPGATQENLPRIATKLAKAGLKCEQLEWEKVYV